MYFRVSLRGGSKRYAARGGFRAATAVEDLGDIQLVSPVSMTSVSLSRAFPSEIVCPRAWERRFGAACSNIIRFKQLWVSVKRLES